jgi:hypothetical protein
MRRFISLSLALLLFLCVRQSSLRAEDFVKVFLHGDSNPSISRFLSCSIYINSEGVANLDINTIRFYVNDKDQTQNLQHEYNTQNQDFYLFFRPRVALPLGRVREKLVALYKDGKIFQKEWQFTVNPAADKALAYLITTIKKHPGDINAHYSLALTFEKKHMLEDAAYEYLKVLRYNPKHYKARAAYERIFTSWDRKSISKEGVVFEVSRDAVLEKLGKLLLFKVMIFNGSRKTLTFDPEKVYIVIDGERGYEPIFNFADYPTKTFESGTISVDDFAKLSYLMEKRNPNGFTRTEISPDTQASGYIGFPVRTLQQKLIIFYLPVKLPSGKYFAYKFPFSGKNY